MRSLAIVALTVLSLIVAGCGQAPAVLGRRAVQYVRALRGLGCPGVKFFLADYSRVEAREEIDRVVERL